MAGWKFVHVTPSVVVILLWESHDLQNAEREKTDADDQGDGANVVVVSAVVSCEAEKKRGQNHRYRSHAVFNILGTLLDTFL